MGRGRALLKCKIAVAGQYREYGYGKVSGWINNLGGSASASVNKDTTHVVATEKAWKRKDAAVAQAIKLNEQGEADIKIVSFDWLEDSVNNKTKKREGPYLWTKLDGTVAKHDAARARAEKAKKPKGHVGMMAEVFQQSTEQYVDPRQAKEVERQIKRDQKAREAQEEDERQEKKAKKEQERKKAADAFGRGAKKAKNEIFTGRFWQHEPLLRIFRCANEAVIAENHHVYADKTGFRLEVTLTKVDTRQNRNERYAITVSCPIPVFSVALSHQADHRSRSTSRMPSHTRMPATFISRERTQNPKTTSSWQLAPHSRLPSTNSRPSSKRRPELSGTIASTPWLIARRTRNASEAKQPVRKTKAVVRASR